MKDGVRKQTITTFYFIQTVVSFSSSHALNCFFLLKELALIKYQVSMSGKLQPLLHEMRVYQSMITRSYKVM